jgi:multimeric flavodoxin WrbA
MKKILVLSGSPVKKGNTATLVGWFAGAARDKGCDVEVVETAFLKHKATGCISCRRCQKSKKFECVIKDDATPVLARMAEVEAIVMATPLYFYGPSAQLKLVFDRMFSLYKWDNKTDSVQTPLKGKTFALLGSAYEDIGLGALEKPFALTARYTEMRFESLLVADAGESGEVKKLAGIREKVAAFAAKVAG